MPLCSRGGSRYRKTQNGHLHTLFYILVWGISSLLEAEYALKTICFIGNQSSPEILAYKREVYRLLKGRYFIGPLATLSDTTQTSLLNCVEKFPTTQALDYAIFRNEGYLVIDLGSPTPIYNSDNTTSVERVKKVVDQLILDALKSFALSLPEDNFIVGIRIKLLAHHMSFSEESGVHKRETGEYILHTFSSQQIDQDLDNVGLQTDYIEIYSHIPIIRRFATWEITNQGLVDQSIILVNGNRIVVDF